MRTTRPLTYEQRCEHDTMQNAPHLLAPEHVLRLDSWHRAGGDVVCDACNRVYYDHPHVVGALWLVELCNGDLVKL